MKVDQKVRCGAQIPCVLRDPSEGYRVCVLAAGHYLEDGPGGRSWHTDCPGVAGHDQPEPDGDSHDHDHRPCVIWSDQAEGAVPSDVAIPEPDPKETGRTLTDLGVYRAEIKIGDTGMTVSGTARLVGHVVSAFADAFEEEAER